MRSSVPPLWRRFLGEPATITGLVLVGILIVLAGPAALLTDYDPMRALYQQFLPPLSGDHWFGTTATGVDLFSSVAHGARVSLSVGVLVAVLSTALGMAIGAVAGYVGGWTDDGLMRVTELFIVIPRFFLALVAVSIFGHQILNIIIVLGLVSWPPIARVIRADYLSLKEREFVQAARVVGSPVLRIVVREILPNAMGPAIVVGSLQVSQAILLEASLAFLGLGDPNLPSWGTILVDAQRFLTSAPWIALFPGLAISLAVIGFNLLGDGLARAVNPRSGSRLRT